MSPFTSPMQAALAEARAAGARGEVPVGAVIVAPDGRIVARAGNRTRELADPTGFAGMEDWEVVGWLAVLDQPADA